jgi:micrococcal nuclease
VYRRALLGILCLAAVAIGIWWFVPRDPVPGAAPPPPAAAADPAGAAPALPGIPPDAFELTVESVHDGDTLRARVSIPNAVVTDLESTRVRLIGIDTPEISPAPECWGAEATAGLTALAPPGTTLWAASDLEVLDQYGRHLLYLWTPDGRFVNAELVAQGDGPVMVFAPNTLHEALFRSLEADAAAAGTGLWGAC